MVFTDPDIRLVGSTLGVDGRIDDVARHTDAGWPVCIHSDEQLLYRRTLDTVKDAGAWGANR